MEVIMKKIIGECLVCGKPLKYYDKDKIVKCVYCNKVSKSKAQCEDGHYVCDKCHAKNGINSIREYCLQSKSKNPIEILYDMMNNKYIYMHGPEHHVMVGSALLTAYKNSGGNIDLEKSLEEIVTRGQGVPGGVCGFWGCCGAGISSGIFMSILTSATPLSKEEWGLSNNMTARSLKEIGNMGGPRCCKRNSFTATVQAVEFVKENFGVEMELPSKIVCEFSTKNRQCIGNRCPYFKNTVRKTQE